MNRLIKWLEESFAPKVSKINSNTWVVAVKDSVMQILPFIFVGSVFCLLTIFSDYISWWPNFWTPYGWTMGLVGLFVAFLIPFNLMERKRLRKQRLIAGTTSVALFLIIISPTVISEGKPGFTSSALGAGGMFAAIIAGLFTGLIMSRFGSFTLFKEDSAVPDFVRGWFDAMLPIIVIVCTGWVLVDLLNLDVYGGITAVFSPLKDAVETPWGFVFVCFLSTFVYSLGISTWVLTPVFTPIALAAINANAAGAHNLYTNETMYAYLSIGGIGATLSLVILFMLSRSKRLKALGRATIVPAIFNINEPVVFASIVWNPVMMIPMWLQGIILPSLVWLFTKVIPFAPVPSHLYQLWYAPYPLCTWLDTQSVRAILLMLLIFVVSAVIWYPFFRAYEKQTIDSEAADAALKAKEGAKKEAAKKAAAVRPADAAITDAAITAAANGSAAKPSAVTDTAAAASGALKEALE